MLFHKISQSPGLRIAGASCRAALFKSLSIHESISSNLLQVSWLAQKCWRSFSCVVDLDPNFTEYYGILTYMNIQLP